MMMVIIVMVEVMVLYVYLARRDQFTSVYSTSWDKETSTIDAVVKCLTENSPVPLQVCWMSCLKLQF